MLGSIIASLILFGTIGTQAATLSFTGVTETGAETPMTSGYFYADCYAPVSIKINPQGIETTAVDVKYFLSGDFEYQTDVVNFSGFTPGVFDEYYPFSSYTLADIAYWTGIAQTWWAVEWWTYEYLNGRNLATWGTISGNSELLFAKIYLKPVYINGSGVLDFYFVGNWINEDDSNVSSGTNNYTQFVDVLSGVNWTEEFTFSSNYGCPFRPYIVEWAKYHTIIGIPNSNSIYTIANWQWNAYEVNTYENDGSGIQTGTVTHRAGFDFTTGSYTDSSTWNLWTNQPIQITFTGNEYSDPRSNIGSLTRDIKMVTWVFANQYISLSGSNNREWTKTIIVTGNVSTGISFYNRIGNSWENFQSGSDNYAFDFKIDVFRFDDAETPVTTGVSMSWNGYALVYLSGTTATNGQQASFTESDDEFRIIKFSWENNTSYGISDPYGYNTILNNLYVQTGEATEYVFTMNKTGLEWATLTPPTAVSTYTGGILFTQTWSGMVYYSDRAGNVSGVFVSVTVVPKVRFEVIVNPAFRNEDGRLWTTGEIRLAYLSGSERAFTHNSVIQSTTDSGIVINDSWTWYVDVVVPASWTEYLAVFKGTGFLSIGFTGIWTNDISDTGTNILDFSGAYNWNVSVSWTIFPKITDGLLANRYYNIAWDVDVSSTGQYDLINAWDLTLVNEQLNINIIADRFYMDFDLNDTINAIEQAIIINYHEQNWWIDEKLNSNKTDFRNF